MADHLDAAQIEEIGAFIAEEMKKLQPQEPSPALEAPSIDTDAIAEAIEASRLDVSSIVTLLTEVMKTVNGIELITVQSAIQSKSRELEKQGTTDGLIESIQAHTRAIDENATKNIETLGNALVTVAQTQADQTKQLVAAIAKQGQEIAALKTVQSEVIDALYAPRDLVFDDDGNPTGLRISRNLDS